MTSYKHLIDSSSPPTPGDSSLELSAINTHLSPEHGSRAFFPRWVEGTKNPVSRQNAVTLSKAPSYLVLSSIWDCCLAILPVTFIVIAILAASLEGNLRSKRGDQIKEATTLIPTIFPITFAALVGYFFRIYGTFRAERGIRLGTLEQLVGSYSFFSAFERQMLLRDFGFVGLVIMAVWALSPIGGQAGLRLLSTSLQDAPYNATNWYLSPLSFRDTSLQGTSAMQTSGDLITSVYVSSLMGSETTAGTGMDLWGSVKIPNINSLKPGANNSDWRTVDWNSTVEFTSLLGLPVGRPMSEGNMTFTVTSHHFDVQCLNNILAEKKDLSALSYNMVNESSGPGHSMLVHLADELPAMTDEVGGDISLRAKFMFGSRTTLHDNTTWGLANCTLGNLAVDSRVECKSESCRVVAMRPSQRVENFISLTNFVNFTLNFLPTATDRDKSTNYLYSATLTERWMNDTALLFRGGRIDMDLWKLDPKVLSARLETALNTFWEAGFATKYRGTSLPKDPAAYEAMGDCSSEVSPLYCFVPVPASGVRHIGEVYKCDRAWFAVFLIICLVLQVLALASVVLKRLTLAPDILGFVSSYTRDNPHAPVSAGSSQDGLVRTRMLKDLRVMLGDVRSAEHVGHISFVAQGDAPIGRLKKGRKYT
ncbi:hypothetical protein I7I48_02620 [Histoplasma ohiense]|nr:hypothetical protein I7I48_02620 [Histoplasma ohiense (nom. inval.)]